MNRPCPDCGTRTGHHAASCQESDLDWSDGDSRQDAWDKLLPIERWREMLVIAEMSESGDDDTTARKRVANLQAHGMFPITPPADTDLRRAPLEYEPQSTTVQ
jgi:hypothetical protein